METNELKQQKESNAKDIFVILSRETFPLEKNKNQLSHLRAVYKQKLLI